MTSARVLSVWSSWRCGLALRVGASSQDGRAWWSAGVSYRGFRDSTEGENIPRGPAEC